MQNNKPEDITLTDQKTKAAQIRGLYIEAVSEIEISIDLAICQYFCGKQGQKMEEFLYSVLSTDKISLHGKLQIFFFIVEKNCPDLFKKHNLQLTKSQKKLNPNYKTFLNRVEDIISTRNILAHRLSRSSGIKDELHNRDIISFETKKAKKGKLQKSILDIDKNQFENMIQEVKDVRKIISEMSAHVHRAPLYKKRKKFLEGLNEKK